MKAVRVLVADDHPVLRGAVVRFLRSVRGVTVIAEASEGGEAVALAERMSPDLVILDVRMPGLNGFEAAAALRQSMPALFIAVMTAANDEAYFEQSRRVQADVFIPKTALMIGLRKLLERFEVRESSADVLNRAA